MADEPFLLKEVFNPETIGIIAAAVAGEFDDFDREGFTTGVFDTDWANRALKQRMRHVTTQLRHTLPDDYPDALAILRRAAPQMAEAGFAAMVASDFVETHGLDHYAKSVWALAGFTKIVSAEFAVRPFLIRYPDKMLAQMVRWSRNRDWRVRRLASEGSRPKLPWGQAVPWITEHPARLRPILEELRLDPSEDVRRSVANSLNDITKSHPELAMAWLTEWQDGSDQMRALTKHALRTLIKDGHAGALDLVGYRPGADVSIAGLTVAPDPVTIGSKATVSFTVCGEGKETQAVMVDGVVTYARPSGTSSKVFKWKTLQVAPEEVVAIKRSVTLQQLSTRTVYPGTHVVEVQVNGERMARREFEVVA